jgi:hypothetical protein
MSDHERSTLEEAVIVIKTKLEEREKAQDSIASWLQVLVAAFVLQLVLTIFLSGIKWNQVDELKKDVTSLESSMAEIQRWYRK